MRRVARVPSPIPQLVVAVVDRRWRWCVIVAGCAVIHRRRHVVTATRRNSSTYPEADETADDRRTRGVATTMVIVMRVAVVPARGLRGGRQRQAGNQRHRSSNAYTLSHDQLPRSFLDNTGAGQAVPMSSELFSGSGG